MRPGAAQPRDLPDKVEEQHAAPAAGLCSTSLPRLCWQERQERYPTEALWRSQADAVRGKREFSDCAAATIAGGRVEKSGSLFEFNFRGRLAIILTFVFIQFLVGLLV